MKKIFCCAVMLCLIVPFSVSSNATMNSGKQLLIGEAESEVLRETNKQRASGKLNALTMNTTLSEVARRYVKIVADKNVLSHDIGGESIPKRLNKAGYKYQKYGENLAAGKFSGIRAVEMWMGSSSHKKNIMNKDFTEIGIGVYKASNGEIFYCQVFGKPQSTK